MSDENNTGTSPESVSIPKYRLDEEIEKRRRAEQEAEFNRSLLQRLAPQQQPRQARPEPKHLVELREQNPAAYMAFKQQEQQLKQITAAQFETAEQLDKRSLIEEFGADARNKLPEIEAQLDQLRRQGNFNFNRHQIFLHLKGLESVRTPAAKAAPVQEKVQDTNVAPPTNANAVDTLRAGSVPTQNSAPKTFEQLEAELENVEF